MLAMGYMKMICILMQRLLQRRWLTVLMVIHRALIIVREAGAHRGQRRMLKITFTKTPITLVRQVVAVVMVASLLV
jgi:hypothetical protein